MKRRWDIHWKPMAITLGHPSMWWDDLCMCEIELIPLNVLTMRSWASFGSCRTFSKLKILFVAGVNLVVSGWEMFREES